MNEVCDGRHGVACICTGVARAIILEDYRASFPGLPAFGLRLAAGLRSHFAQAVCQHAPSTHVDERGRTRDRGGRRPKVCAPSLHSLSRHVDEGDCARDRASRKSQSPQSKVCLLQQVRAAMTMRHARGSSHGHPPSPWALPMAMRHLHRVTPWPCVIPIDSFHGHVPSP